MPVINILPRTQFPILESESAGGKYVIVNIASNIPVADARELVLLVRVHDAAGGLLTGAKIEAQMFNSAPTAEDPGKIFRTPMSAQLGTTTSWLAGDGVPGLATGGVTSGVGEAVDVFLYLYQATAAIDLFYTVSVDLVWKT